MKISSVFLAVAVVAIGISADWVLQAQVDSNDAPQTFNFTLPGIDGAPPVTLTLPSDIDLTPFQNLANSLQSSSSSSSSSSVTVMFDAAPASPDTVTNPTPSIPSYTGPMQNVTTVTPSAAPSVESDAEAIRRPSRRTQSHMMSAASSSSTKKIAPVPVSTEVSSSVSSASAKSAQPVGTSPAKKIPAPVVSSAKSDESLTSRAMHLFQSAVSIGKNVVEGVANWSSELVQSWWGEKK